MRRQHYPLYCRYYGRHFYRSVNGCYLIFITDIITAFLLEKKTEIENINDAGKSESEKLVGGIKIN